LYQVLICRSVFNPDAIRHQPHHQNFAMLKTERLILFLSKSCLNVKILPHFVNKKIDVSRIFCSPLERQHGTIA